MSSKSLSGKNLPALLGEIASPPKKIYFQGDFPIAKPHVGIVGTRKATAEGLTLAREFGENFAKRGVVVVSGLAMGIDTAAHEGALAGRGPTIAVLPGSVTNVYPRQNEKLAQNILKGGGALISEYPENAETFPGNFIARNRIVAGLSQGVVIIEAPERSGTLATARFALEANREVFVVPGNVKHPNYRGSLKLLREGARLVRSAEDVLEDLNLLPIGQEEAALPLSFDLSERERKMLTILQTIGKPVLAEQLIAASGEPAHQVGIILGNLVIQGVVKETNGYYHL